MIIVTSVVSQEKRKSCNEVVSTIHKSTYMSKVVIVHVDTSIGEDLGEVVGGADEEVVSNDVGNHLLVQITVCYLLPICVLQISKAFLITFNLYVSTD